MEFKPITTQEEFDKAIQERLNRQKETIEKQYADYAEIKARNQELETEVGTLKAALAESNEKAGKYDKDISELNAKIAGYETANMRTKIALQHGIPYELASRLVGEDEKSITEDAKKLAELVGKKEPIAPLKDTEPPVDDKDGAYKALLENLNLEGE
jgi:septal ring factor EnvC (AmiA/AmiB activator)